jgi:hypothetical protein
MYFAIAPNQLCGKYTNYLPQMCGVYFIFSLQEMIVTSRPAPGGNKNLLMQGQGLPTFERLGYRSSPHEA